MNLGGGVPNLQFDPFFQLGTKETFIFSLFLCICVNYIFINFLDFITTTYFSFSGPTLRRMERRFRSNGMFCFRRS